jgi:hypothetical protein
VHGELAFVGLQLPLGLLQLERELRRRGAVARLEIGLGLGLELLDVRLVRLDLARDALDQPAVLLEPPRPSLSCSTAWSYS